MLKNQKRHTHSSKCVCNGSLTIRKPQCCQFGWSEHDKGLSTCSYGLAYHENWKLVTIRNKIKLGQIPYYSTNKIQPCCRDNLIEKI